MKLQEITDISAHPALEDALPGVSKFVRNQEVDLLWIEFKDSNSDAVALFDAFSTYVLGHWRREISMQDATIARAEGPFQRCLAYTENVSQFAPIRTSSFTFISVADYLLSQPVRLPVPFTILVPNKKDLHKVLIIASACFDLFDIARQVTRNIYTPVATEFMARDTKMAGIANAVTSWHVPVLNVRALLFDVIEFTAKNGGLFGLTATGANMEHAMLLFCDPAAKTKEKLSNFFEAADPFPYSLLKRGIYFDSLG